MDKYKLFDKYLRADLSDEEADELTALLEDEAIGQELVEYSLETKLFVDYGKKVKNRISLTQTTSRNWKPKKKRRSLLPVLLMAALLALAYLGYSFYSEKNTVLISANSLVKVNRNGELLDRTQPIREGDAVEAQEESELTLEDGSILHLNKGTLLEVKELVFNKVFYLKKGQVHIKASKQEIGDLKVITKDAVTEVIGTEFIVNKLKAGTLLEVQSGVVNFANENESLQVNAGERIYADPKKGLQSLDSPVKNIRWHLWNKEAVKDPDLHFYTDFKNGKHKGALVEGEILYDEFHFMRNGIITYENSEKFTVGKEITLFAWVKITEPLVHAPILTKGDNAWRLQINKVFPHAGYGGLNSGKKYFDSEFELELNKWYMIHQLISENNVKIFVNGKLVTSKDITSPVLNNDKLVMLGGNSDKDGFKFLGDIGEAGLYNRKLSIDEISDMYESGKFNEDAKVTP